MSELWRAYGISRPTGYEVLARYQAHGLDGVRERSRAAQHHPNQIGAGPGRAGGAGAPRAPALGAAQIAGLDGA